MTSYRTKQLVFNILKYILLIIVAIVMLFPLIVVLSSSFKMETEIFAFPFTIFPKNPILSNFEQLADNFPMYTWNSVKVTFITTIVQLVTASTGAYVFSKIQWKGRNALFMLYVMSMMIPSQAVTVPQFIIVRNLGLFDTHTAIVLLGAFTAVGTFLIRQYMLSIPETYNEAARIDGAREWVIFGRIILPMTKPVLITQAIFSFRYFWNDFYTPLLYIITPELKTLPLGMTDFTTEQYVYYGPQMAAALISIIPVLIIFLIGQKYFIQGVSAAGIKG